MPVLSLEESQPVLEPVAGIVVPTLHESNAQLMEILDGHPELHATLDSSTKASMLSNLFAHNVTPQLAMIGITWCRAGRMQHGSVDGLINLRFKKLTLDLHSMNVPTGIQTQLYHQSNIPGFDDLTQVTFGYIPDLIRRTIAAMFFVCPKSWRKNHWSWNLTGGSDGMGLFGCGPEPIDPDVVDPNLDVTVSVSRANTENA